MQLHPQNFQNSSLHVNNYCTLNSNVHALHSNCKYSSIIRVNCNQTFSNALLDTGSQFSIVSDDFLTQLGVVLQPIAPQDQKSLLTADKSRMHVLGKTQLSFKIQDIKFEKEFLVVPHLVYPMLLGFDFCCEHGINFDLSNGVVTFPKHHMSVQLINAQEFKGIARAKIATILAPRSTTIVPIQSHFGDFLIPLNKPLAHFKVSPHVIRHQGQTCAVLYNTSAQPFYLNRGGPVANVLQRSNLGQTYSPHLNQTPNKVQSQVTNTPVTKKVTQSHVSDTVTFTPPNTSDKSIDTHDLEKENKYPVRPTPTLTPEQQADKIKSIRDSVNQILAQKRSHRSQIFYYNTQMCLQSQTKN